MIHHDENAFVPILSLCLLPVLSFSGPAQEAKRNDPWFGFEVGSWVIVNENGTWGKKIDRQTKIVVSKYRDGGPEMSRYAETDGNFDKLEGTFSHGPGQVPDENHRAVVEKRALVLGGKKLACTYQEYAWEDAERSLKVKLKLWRATGVSIPYRELPAHREYALGNDVVKAEFSFDSKRDKGEARAEIVGWDEKIQVGKRTLSCIREKAAVKFTREGVAFEAQGEQWLSDEVPGRQAILTGKEGDQAFEMEKRLLDFHVKKQ